jgi:hypothetical protein
MVTTNICLAFSCLSLSDHGCCAVWDAVRCNRVLDVPTADGIGVVCAVCASTRLWLMCCGCSRTRQVVLLGKHWCAEPWTSVGTAAPRHACCVHCNDLRLCTCMPVMRLFTPCTVQMLLCCRAVVRASGTGLRALSVGAHQHRMRLESPFLGCLCRTWKVVAHAPH